MFNNQKIKDLQYKFDALDEFSRGIHSILKDALKMIKELHQRIVELEKRIKE